MRPAAAWIAFALAVDASFAASLRFHGNGIGDIDRVKIRIDDHVTTVPGPPADVGSSDFTIEFWMRARASENTAGPVSCGANVNWIYGNIVVDRDRYNQDRKWGLSIAGGRWVWGASGDGTGDRTICGATGVLDDVWHHVAVQRRRSDGRMWLFVDGALEAQSDGPDGDVSYPDDGVPGNYCGGPCTNSDPFLVLAAEKHDAGPAYPSYAGLIDEMRISTVLRYDAPFGRPTAPFVPDSGTAALYHFDEGSGESIGDASGAPGGPSDGVRRFGGSPAGPEWVADSPFGAGPGRVPDGSDPPGAPLRVSTNGNALDLTWGASCGAAADYAIYEGTIGAWTTHAPNTCSSGGQLAATIDPLPGDRYLLIVPQASASEGSYGRSTAGERAPAGSACAAPGSASCP